MKKLFGFILFLGVTVVTFLSCEKPESYSDVPEIEFLNYRIYDTVIPPDFNQRRLAISFKFVDGDGDIGYREDIADSTKKDNLFFSKYAQIKGNYINIDSTLPSPTIFRIPYEDIMERSGQNKTMKGTIKVELSETPIKYDSIKYDFYIVDRAGNKSNVTSTTEIIGLKSPSIPKP